MDIRVGQKWKTRDGTLATIANRNYGTTFRWTVRVGEPNGFAEYCVTTRGAVSDVNFSDDDLVELVEDSPPADGGYDIPVSLAPPLRKIVEDTAVASLSEQSQSNARELFTEALTQSDHPYHALADTLLDAFRQAAIGKGKDRHANEGTPFHEQPMATINRQLGSIDGFIYQAHKKSLEAKRLPDGRAQAEMLGAINYLAGSIIALNTWAKK